MGSKKESGFFLEPEKGNSTSIPQTVIRNYKRIKLGMKKSSV